MSQKVLIDETGNRYGRLLVLHRSEKPTRGTNAVWMCKCDCGRITHTKGTDLRRGISSCGCVGREMFRRNCAANIGKIENVLRWRREHPQEAARHRKRFVQKFAARRPSDLAPVLRWWREHPAEFARRRNAAVRASDKAKRALQALHSPEYLAKAVATRSGMPGFRPDEQHFAAKWWCLRDPTGRAYEFRNLAKFVRDHTELFDPADLMWRHRGNGVFCNAYSGLASLNPRCRRTDGAWKGWTWAANSAVTKAGADILERQLKAD